jgi:hypothetical protein
VRETGPETAKAFSFRAGKRRGGPGLEGRRNLQSLHRPDPRRRGVRRRGRGSTRPVREVNRRRMKRATGQGGNGVAHGGECVSQNPQDAQGARRSSPGASPPSGSRRGAKGLWRNRRIARRDKSHDRCSLLFVVRSTLGASVVGLPNHAIRSPPTPARKGGHIPLRRWLHVLIPSSRGGSYARSQAHHRRLSGRQRAR